MKSKPKSWLDPMSPSLPQRPKASESARSLGTAPHSENSIIKCLSIRQPYADQIFFCDKWCENRSWETSYRGEMWIHSSTIEKSEKADPDKSPTGLLTGHIIGRVNLVACLTGDQLFSLMPDNLLAGFRRKPWQKPDFDESSDGSYLCRDLLKQVSPESWGHFVIGTSFAWIFADPEMLDKPIPTGGKLRLWDFETTESRLLMADDAKANWR